MTITYPTLDARKNLLESDLHTSPDIKRVHLAVLERALTYFFDISVDALRDMRLNRSYVQLRVEFPIWIEFSQPLPQEYTAFTSASGRMNQEARTIPMIAALLYYCPAGLNYELDLFLSSGHLTERFYYYTASQRWGYPSNCKKCTHTDHTAACGVQKYLCMTHHCQEHSSYLNAWRTRFRQALMLIQANNYRPGAIGIPDISI